MGSLYLCVFGEGMTRWVEGGQMKWEPGKEEKDKKTEKSVRRIYKLNLVYVSVKKIKGLTFQKSELKKKTKKIQTMTIKTDLMAP